MPFFINQHDINETVTPESELKSRLEVHKNQHLFKCRKLCYWFDKERQVSFCLYEAPDKESVEFLINQTQKHIPSQIIEVDKILIDNFLKQIQNLSDNETLELLYTSPTFIAFDLVFTQLNGATEQLQSIHNQYHQDVNNTIKTYKSNVITQRGSFFLVAFESRQEAITAALEMHHNFSSTNKSQSIKTQLKIGISGILSNVSLKEAIRLGKRLCYIAQDKIMLPLEIKNQLFDDSGKIWLKHNEQLKSVEPDEIRFLTDLLDFMEDRWKNPNLHAGNLEKHLGWSKSHLYRKMMSLIGCSANTFIKEYRMKRATKLLRQKKGNISEIAFDTGFGSPSYFTKCFQQEYGVKPSEYLSVLTNSKFY
ncbi:MAG TPA: nickel-binding protein [Draconibacterium sp.]|nr:nickel-binding protein [Draconibacterium sp.]